MTSTVAPPGNLPLEEFRNGLRFFLAEHHPGRGPREADMRFEWARSWQATLFDHGFAGPSWPAEYGGMALPFSHQVVYQEELARAHVPGPVGTGLGIAAPAIIRYATEEQKQRWLAPMLRGDRVWVQGYSEPGAGSDLASLRTTARRDGEDYLVSGQKVWTSQGTRADVLFALVRTGTRESRQDGISYLIIDAHADGVTIRPLRDLTGGHAFAEVFLDNVRVPVADRIGEENKGWPLARTSLGHERAAGAMNQAARYRRVLTELEDLLRSRGLLARPAVRERVAEFEVRARIMNYNAQRTIADILDYGEPGPASSISRLFIAAFEQDLHEFAVDALGPAGLLNRGSPEAVQKGRWLYGFLRTRASTIGAGTAEIQRNIIAERVLEMPRDPAMPR